MKEIWKDIKGYEGLYQVSNLGRVKSLLYKSNKWDKFVPREKILNIYFHPTCSYEYCVIYKNKHRKKYYIHGLLAEHFIPNPDNKPEVNHKDYNKRNNKLENLEWVTRSENITHAMDNNLMSGKPKKVKGVCLKTGETVGFNSLLDGASYIRNKYYNKYPKASAQHISLCLNQKRKTAYGYKWYEWNNNPNFVGNIERVYKVYE